MADINPTSGSMPTLDAPVDSAVPNELTQSELKTFVAQAPRSKLFNRSTGKSEAMPFDKIAPAIQSGTHGYKKGTKVRVVDEVEGDTFEVPADGIQEALAAGLRLEAPQESAVREFLDKPQNKGFDGAIKVFSKSALNEFAFGVPGVIEKNTADPLDLARAEALEERFKLADLGGSLTGIVTNALTTRGLNIGAKGVKLAGTALNKVLGRQAAQTVGEEASKQIIKQGVVAGVAKKAAEFGIEGAAYAAPAAITEAAFGNPDDAAQTILGSFGVGALFGGGIGAGGAIIKGAKALRASRAGNIDKAKEVSYKLVGANAEQVTKIQEFSPKVDAGLPQYLADFGKIDESILGDAKKLGKAIDDRTDFAGQRLGLMFDAVDTKVGKALGIADDIERAEIAAAFPEYKKLHTELYDEFIAPNVVMREGVETLAPGIRAEIQEAKAFLEDSTKYIQAKYGSFQPTSLSALTDMRGKLKQAITRNREDGSAFLNNMYKKYEAKLSDIVENQVAPAIESKFDDLAGLSDEIKFYNNEFHIGATVGRTVKKTANRKMLSSKGLTVADAGVAMIAKGAKQSMQYLLGKELVTKYVGRWELRNLQNINKGIQAQAKVIDNIPDILSKKKPYNSVLKEAYDTLLPAGSSLKGSTFRNINETLMDAFNIEGDTKSTNYEELYKKVSEKLSTMSYSSAYTANTIAEQYASVAELGAPKLAQSLNAFTINNLEYIKSIMPKPNTLPNAIFKQKPYTPSDRDMYKFARKMEIVNNPMSLLGNLQDGTLSQDEVKVAQDLYPYVLNKIRAKVTDYLATYDKIIPYQERLKYSLLLGLDADASTLPAHVLAYQITYIKYLDNDLPAQTNQSKSLSTYKAEDMSTQISRISSST